MRLIIAIVLTAVLAGLATIVLPWWMIAVVAFLVALSTGISAGKGFVSGFFGIALLWFTIIIFRDAANEHILSARMAKLFGLPNSFLFLFVNVFLGALVGGIAGWAGVWARQVVKK